MTAPAEVRSITGEVKTTLPGITFGGTFPKLAQMADQLAVVRYYASRNGDHSYLSVTGGGNPLKAAMGALYARVAGPTHPRTGMPNNVLVLPEAVQPGLKLQGNFETGALPTLDQPRRPRHRLPGVRSQRRRPVQEEPATAAAAATLRRPPPAAGPVRRACGGKSTQPASLDGSIDSSSRPST